MASDHAQYNRALRQWDTLHDQGCFSVPIDQGAVAVLWSNYTMGDHPDRKSEIEAFSEDAYDIAKELAMFNIDCQVFGSYRLEDAEEVLRDPDFISVVTIGHGNLSETYCHNGESFDWRFVSEHATHLKTGRFIQRHCGHPIRDLSAPLGTFAMAEHSKVYAAYDTYLPTVMNNISEEKIKRLHTHKRLGYRALKSLFIREELRETSNAPTDTEDKPEFD